MYNNLALAEKTHDMLNMSGDITAKGAILVEMGRYDEAFAAFKNALEKSDASDVLQAVKDNVRLFHHSNLVAVEIGRKDLKKAKAEAGGEEAKAKEYYAKPHTSTASRASTMRL